MYNVDHQSSFMSKGSDFFKDVKGLSERRGRYEEEHRGRSDIDKGRERSGMDESRERSLDRNSDRLSQDRNPDREVAGKDRYSERDQEFQRSLDRRSFDRRSLERNQGLGSHDWTSSDNAANHGERRERDNINVLYGDFKEVVRGDNDKESRDLTGDLMNIRARSDVSSQFQDKKEIVSSSQTRRSVSPRDRKEGPFSKEGRRNEEFTSNDKGNYDSDSPVKKKKAKKLKNKDSKREKRKRKSKGSISPIDKKHLQEGEKGGKADKREWDYEENYSRDPKKEKKDYVFQEEFKSKTDKKFKRRKEYSSERETEKNVQTKGGSLEEVVKSRWDSPSDEKYYKTLNPERKSRFDGKEKLKDQKLKPETTSKFSNTFKEAVDGRDYVKEEPKAPSAKKQIISVPKDVDNSRSKEDSKKFVLPSKEEISREFEGIRIHIRNDKYNIEDTQGNAGKSGIRPMDSMEEDPVSIVSALHTDQIYAPKEEPVFQEEMFEVKIKRDDSPRYERPRSNYRRKRSHSSSSSSSSSSRSRSTSHDRGHERKSSRSHDRRRSKSYDRQRESSSSRFSQSDKKRSWSPHKNEEEGPKNDIGKKMFEINKYNKNRFQSDGKSLTIKPFIKLEVGSRGRGARGDMIRGGARGRGDGIRGGIRGRADGIRGGIRGRGDWMRGGSRGRGDFKFNDGRGKFIPRGRGTYRGNRQFRGNRGRGGNFKSYHHPLKRRSRDRSRSSSRSSDRSRGRSRRSWSRSRSRSRSRSGHRSRSRSKHRSVSPRGHPVKGKSSSKKRESWSPPIGQGSGYYGPKANKEKSTKPDPVEVGEGPSTQPSDGAPVPKDSSLEQMETFLEELRQKKMQAAANNNF